jgi:hypothetical protein
MSLALAVQASASRALALTVQALALRALALTTGMVLIEDGESFYYKVNKFADTVIGLLKSEI